MPPADRPQSKVTMAWQPPGNSGWGWVPPPVASAPQFAPPVAQFAPPVAQFAPPVAQYAIHMPEYRSPPRYVNPQQRAQAIALHAVQVHHGRGDMYRSHSTSHGCPAAAPALAVVSHVTDDDSRFRFQNGGQHRGRSPSCHGNGHHDDRRGSWHESPPHRHRDSSPGYWQNEQLRKEVEDLRRDKERKEEEERIKKDMLMKIALKEKKEREEQDRAKVIGKQAVADFKRKEAEEKEKKRVAEEKNEEEYRRRLQRDLGLSETQISRIVKTDLDKAIDLRRTTHTKIARRHISIETLRAFGLPFKLDDVGRPGKFVSLLLSKEAAANPSFPTPVDRTRPLRPYQALGSTARTGAALGPYPTRSRRPRHAYAPPRAQTRY